MQRSGSVSELLHGDPGRPQGGLTRPAGAEEPAGRRGGDLRAQDPRDHPGVARREHGEQGGDPQALPQIRLIPTAPRGRRERLGYVLGRMREDGVITPEQKAEALTAPPKIVPMDRQRGDRDFGCSFLFQPLSGFGRPCVPS